MDSWFSITLGDALISQPALDELQNQLSVVYEQAETSEIEMLAAFYRYVSKDVHCYITVYLTAEFQQKIKHCAAVRCPPPCFSDITFLAGNNKLESLLKSSL